jgi:hypothetical protein
MLKNLHSNTDVYFTKKINSQSVSHNCFYYSSKPECAIPDDNVCIYFRKWDGILAHFYEMIHRCMHTHIRLSYCLYITALFMCVYMYRHTHTHILHLPLYFHGQTSLQMVLRTAYSLLHWVESPSECWVHACWVHALIRLSYCLAGHLLYHSSPHVCVYV